MLLRTTLTLFTLAAAMLIAEPTATRLTDSIDPACKPCQDFWRHANGKWIDANPIPAAYPSWGRMAVMRDGNNERLKVILDGAAAKAKAGSGAQTNEERIGLLYASCMDAAAIEKAGLAPLKADLDVIAAIKDRASLQEAIRRSYERGISAPFTLGASQDYKQPTETVATLVAGGLTLPDRDYYLRDDARSKEIRDRYRQHVSGMFQLLGETPERAATLAGTVLAFETRLAGATMTRVERRDPYARYNKMDVAGVAALTPGFDWKAFLTSQAVKPEGSVIVTEPKFFQAFQKELAETPLADWQTYLRWRLVDDAAPHLPARFADADFAFKGKVLRGTPEQRPRWQRCTAVVDSALGDALGEVYVRKHFPPEAKRRMDELVSNLKLTLADELATAAWLSPETRQQALAKLKAISPKIGYPDKWKDYSSVTMSGTDLMANLEAAQDYARRRSLGKIGKPLDRTEWGMTPPTVNAYYSGLRNEIAFPAGILQAPMFDLAADDAANYGAIGAVIGHEIGHGFDDQGSKFDAQGALRNWWTKEDRERFDARAACIIDQFSEAEVGPGQRHTGKLVTGEALGDLGGLTLAYKAYQRSLKGKPGPVLSGLTADQRFFLAFAQVWGAHARPEQERLQLQTDPHPLARFRANETLKNMPEFHRAFQCQLGDAMVRPVEKQCKLW